jgi:hypothetical protein
MSNEIFDNFIKIALDKGMITKDPIKKIAKDNGSSDISSIEVLYGTKPKLPSEMRYKRNIIEDAHPNSVIISPSYDKINGLVENNNERQDIILNILNKTPTGVLTNHKYAEKELILSLVRLGNYLDNRDAEQLRVLADVCLEQVASKPLKKEAQWTLPIIGISAAIGALYLQQHLPMQHQDFSKDNAQLIREIDDMLEDKSDFGISGNNYSTELIRTLNEFKNKLVEVSNEYANIVPIINQLEKPRDVKELIEVSKHPETMSIKEAVTNFKLKFSKILTFINTIESNFKNQSFKSRNTESKGVITSLIDRIQVLRGGKGLIADDFDDIVRAIESYKQSVKEVLSILNGYTNMRDKINERLEQAQSELSGLSAEPATTVKSSETSDEETKSALGLNGLDDKMKSSTNKS